MEPERLMTMKDAARLIGVHPQTVRTWERSGVIAPTRRRRGIRVFTEDDIRRIKATVFECGPTACEDGD